MTHDDKTVSIHEERPSRPSKAGEPPEPGETVSSEHHQYRLLNMLGRGGFGTVYEAECLNPDPLAADAPPQRTALKWMRGVAVKRDAIRRELAALQAIDSPRIPKVYDWHSDADAQTAFFVMDFYPRGDLNFRFDKLPTPQALWSIFHDILAALIDIHRAGILHLDVKPGNILIDNQGGYVLTDLGLNQSVQLQDQSQETLGAGTRGYRAPELRFQSKQQADVRTDLFGAAATIWSLATGKAPVQSDSKEYDTTEGLGLPDIRDLRPDIPPRFHKLLEQCLRAKKEERPGSAAIALVRLKRSQLASAELPAVQSFDSDSEVDKQELEDIIVDPFWQKIVRYSKQIQQIVKLNPGDVLCRSGEQTYEVFLLLKGRLEVETHSGERPVISRTGVFIGEVSALTGRERTATVLAQTESWLAVFNPAEFDAFLAANPSAANMLIRDMAERIYRESQ